MAIRCALNLKGHVIPLIVERIAANARRVPLLILVVPDIPLIPSRDAALMPPDEGVAVHKLIDIELKCLRQPEVIRKKVDVVDEVVRLAIDAVAVVRDPLRGQLADQVVVPKHIRISSLARDIELHGVAAERGGADALYGPPGRLRSGGGAGRTNGVGGRQKSESVPSFAALQIGDGVARVGRVRRA